MKLKNYKKNTIAFATLTKHKESRLTYILRAAVFLIRYSLPHTWKNGLACHYVDANGDSFPRTRDKQIAIFWICKKQRYIPTSVG